MTLSKMFFFFVVLFCFFILRSFTYRKRIRVKFTMNHVAQVLRLVDVGFTYLPLSSNASDTLKIVAICLHFSSICEY